MSAVDIQKRANAVISAAQAQTNAALGADDAREAKAILTAAIRDLRDLKRLLADEQRAIREDATDARQKISGTGQMVGMFAGSKARGAMARGRASAQRDLAKRREAALRPYVDVKAGIDNAISQLDRAKAGLPAGSGSSARRAAPTAPPPPPTPAAWAADPFGRHEHRYWDGQQWTHHVSDRGKQSIDPPNL